MDFYSFLLTFCKAPGTGLLMIEDLTSSAHCIIKRVFDPHCNYQNAP